MTIQEALEEFLFQKELAGLAYGSVKNYRATLSLFLRDIGSDLPLSEVSYPLVTNYILKLYKAPISRATTSSYVRNVRIFLRWVYIEYELSFDPIKIKVPKSPKKNVHIYSDSEVRYIFSLVRTSIPWMTARNKAILALMLDSGLRQCEVCGLRSVDVDIERYIMKVTGKGSKDRMVPLGRMSLQLMNDYLNMCPFKDSDYVFVDRHGSFLSGNAVRLFVYHLERKLPFKFSSHKLRHNFATNYCIDHVRETGKSDVYDLSILMGHESIETTKKYEHFAHEIIASENSISHLDNVYKVI
ncbi:MAG: tyrosine-type recombinase/integrase [Clostridium sp.]